MGWEQRPFKLGTCCDLIGHTFSKATIDEHSLRLGCLVQDGFLLLCPQ